MFAAIERYPFATVASADPRGGAPSITHLPILLDRDRGPHGTLLGHLGRANPHRQLLAQGAATTTVFNGPHAYITPSWYAQEPAIPTWNYVAVHATGPPHLVDDEAYLLALLSRTVTVCEAAYGDTTPWHLDTHSDYVAGFTSAIVAFEILLTTLEASFKLSQNIEEPLREQVIEGLRRRQQPRDTDLADTMETYPPPSMFGPG